MCVSSTYVFNLKVIKWMYLWGLLSLTLSLSLSLIDNGNSLNAVVECSLLFLLLFNLHLSLHESVFVLSSSLCLAALWPPPIELKQPNILFICLGIYVFLLLSSVCSFISSFAPSIGVSICHLLACCLNTTSNLHPLFLFFCGKLKHTRLGHPLGGGGML